MAPSLQQTGIPRERSDREACTNGQEQGNSSLDTIRLTHTEALVLYEFLARGWQARRYDIAHEEEQLVLSRIEAQLEKRLAEPFAPDYVAIQARARRVVREAFNASPEPPVSD